MQENQQLGCLLECFLLVFRWVYPLCSFGGSCTVLLSFRSCHVQAKEAEQAEEEVCQFGMQKWLLILWMHETMTLGCQKLKHRDLR